MEMKFAKYDSTHKKWNIDNDLVEQKHRKLKIDEAAIINYRQVSFQISIFIKLEPFTSP